MQVFKKKQHYFIHFPLCSSRWNQRWSLVGTWNPFYRHSDYLPALAPHRNRPAPHPTPTVTVLLFVSVSVPQIVCCIHYILILIYIFLFYVANCEGVFFFSYLILNRPINLRLMMEVADIEYVPPKLHSHEFVQKLCEQSVVYQCIKMDKSLLVWVGLWSDPSFSDISIAMKTPYNSSPLVTHFMGSQADTASSNLAARLSKRLNKPVYVSFNLPSDLLTLNAVEAQISEEMKKFPDKF